MKKVLLERVIEGILFSISFILGMGLLFAMLIFSLTVVNVKSTTDINTNNQEVCVCVDVPRHVHE